MKTINNIVKYLNKLFSGNWKVGSIPKYWDGNTSERIIKHILTSISFICLIVLHP